MPSTRTRERLRGHIRTYDTSSIGKVDAHLRQLTEAWAAIRYTAPTPPSDEMRAGYRNDIDMLLDARVILAKS